MIVRLYYLFAAAAEPKRHRVYIRYTGPPHTCKYLCTIYIINIYTLIRGGTEEVIIFNFNFFSSFIIIIIINGTRPCRRRDLFRGGRTYDRDDDDDATSPQTAKPDTRARGLYTAIPTRKHTPCDLPTTGGVCILYTYMRAHNGRARTTGCGRHVFCHLPECYIIRAAHAEQQRRPPYYCNRRRFISLTYVYYYFHKRALHMYITHTRV